MLAFTLHSPYPINPFTMFTPLTVFTSFTTPKEPCAMNPTEVPPILRLTSVRRAASVTGLHPHTIYRWIRAGRIRAWGVQNSYRVDPAELLPPVQPGQRRRTR